MIELQNEPVLDSLKKEQTVLASIPPIPAVPRLRIYSNLVRLKEFLNQIGMHPIDLVIPSILAFAATLFEGISIGLLIPTLKGLINKDFGFVRDLPILANIFDLFPEKVIQSNYTIFSILVVSIFVSAVSKNVLQYLSSCSIAFQVTHSASNLRKLIYERYLSFGKLYFDQHNAGHLHQILMGYTQQVALRIQSLHTALFQFFTVFVYFTLMLLVSWHLTLFVVILLPTLYFCMRWIIETIKRTSKSYADSYSELGKKIGNSLTCIPLVKAYWNEKGEKERFNQTNNIVEKLEFSMYKKELLVLPLQEIIVLSVFLALAGAMAFLLVRLHMGDIAGFLVFFFVLKRCIWALGFYNFFLVALATVSGPLHEILNVLNDHEKHFVPDGSVEFKGIRNRIEFNHISFSYVKGVYALRDITLSVEKGKITAVVGSSGSGKTTLIHLLMRFYDCPAGSLLIDGIDIRNFSTASLLSKIALVSQEPLLINTSLRFNLMYGMNDQTLNAEEMMKTLKKARLYDFVQNLPLGLETEIGDRGIQLSGGEKQRVAIARAMLRNPEILLLDEATSALDTRTEQLIQEAIDELIKDRTAIVVAHRMSTIQNADKIAVIESGRLVEEGTLDKLLSYQGKFYEYWKAQEFNQRMSSSNTLVEPPSPLVR